MGNRNVSKYGWHRDIPDFRDYSFSLNATVVLPPKVDLTANCPAVYNQGQLGSCTANAICGAVEFDFLKQGHEDIMPSRLFVYYNERLMEGTVKFDAGAQIRDGIKTVANQGVCRETSWKYDITKFKRKPSAFCYKSALTNLVTSYQRLPQNLNTLKQCLAEGFPFVFGFAVYESFETQEVANTGVAIMPIPNDTMLGGHAVMCVGYDDSTQRFIVRNSWGTNWGNNGYFTIPYQYLTNLGLAADFWTIRTVL